MVVVLSGGGIVNDNHFRRVQVKILDLSMFVLHGACALSAVMVLYLHWDGGSARSYWWYALPLAATAR